MTDSRTFALKCTLEIGADIGAVGLYMEDFEESGAAKYGEIVRTAMTNGVLKYKNEPDKVKQNDKETDEDFQERKADAKVARDEWVKRNTKIPDVMHALFSVHWMSLGPNLQEEVRKTGELDKAKADGDFRWLKTTVICQLGPGAREHGATAKEKATVKALNDLEMQPSQPLTTFKMIFLMYLGLYEHLNETYDDKAGIVAYKTP